MPPDIIPLDVNEDATRMREANARVGTCLRGKWHLDSLIAIGGMGAVYEATHRNGLRGAVKILDPILSASVANRRRFLREGKLANQVQHAGAVQVLDDDEAEDGSAYLVMELLTGSTLEAIAATSRDGKLEPRLAIEYGLQVVDTLREAHASGIVHRDIKPENLLLTEDGIVKVLDFGIAGVLARGGSATVTQSGEPVGTPAFMSPEQARGRWELVDSQSDLYSLGASLFTLMAGRLVHANAETVAEMLVVAITCEPPSLREVLPDVPIEVVKAIDGALKVEKSERWQNAEAMRMALEKAYIALTGATPPAPRRMTLRPVMKSSPQVARTPLQLQTTIALRRFPNAAWAGICVAVMGVGGLLFVSRTHDHPVAAASPNQVTWVDTTGAVAPALNASVRVEASAPASTPSVSSARPESSAPISTSSRTRPAHRYDPLYDRRY